MFKRVNNYFWHQLVSMEQVPNFGLNRIGEKILDITNRDLIFQGSDNFTGIDILGSIFGLEFRKFVGDSV